MNNLKPLFIFIFILLLLSCSREILINTIPEGAEIIYSNDSFISPATITTKLNDDLISIKKVGFEDKVLSIKEIENDEISIELNKKYYNVKLQFTSIELNKEDSPSKYLLGKNTRIDHYINGKNIESNKLLNLTYGDHTYKMAIKGYPKEYLQEFKVTNEMVLNISNEDFIYEYVISRMSLNHHNDFLGEYKIAKIIDKNSNLDISNKTNILKVSVQDNYYLFQIVNPKEKQIWVRKSFNIDHEVWDNNELKIVNYLNPIYRLTLENKSTEIYFSKDGTLPDPKKRYSFKIGLKDIGLNSKIRDMIKLLDEKPDIENKFVGKTYKWNGIEVSTINGVIGYFTITTPDYPMFLGVRVGDPYERVIDTFGKAKLHENSIVYQEATGESTPMGDIYNSIFFIFKDGKICSIECGRVL